MPVPVHKAIPFLMIGFVSYISTLIKRRRIHLNQILSKDIENSLPNCLMKAGLDKADFKKKKITYSIVE